MTKYVTQGTVQIQQEHADKKQEPKFTAWINPVSDYTVKHREKEYIVFISEEAIPPDYEVEHQGDKHIVKKSTFLKKNALAFEKKQQFSLSEELAELCEYDTKIEIGIVVDGEDMNPEIISLKIPASF